MMTENTSNTSKELLDAYVATGKRLQQARTDAGLTLKEVSQQLHLSGMIIDDIEQGRTDRLSPLYRRGYIANYARLLGLDPEPLMAALAQDEPPALREVLPVKQHGWKLERYLRVATYILVTTVIVPPLVIFFIEGGSRIMERDPVVAENEVPGSVQVAEHEPPGRTRMARALSLDESYTSSDTGDAGHVAASAMPLAAARPGRDSPLQETETGEILLPAAELLEAGGEEERDTSIELSIELLEDSWVEIHDAGGKRLEYDLLRTGQSRQYRGEPPFQLLLGRARAVEVRIGDELVTYDGHDRTDVARFQLLAEGEVER